MSHHIVIVPKVTLGKWRQEIEEWFPTTRCFYFYGSKEERVDLVVQLRKHKFDILLTTFEMAMNEVTELSKIQWEYLILDEAQRIKNDEGKLSQLLRRRFNTRHKVLLTGTPLQNNLKELWALLNFLMPGLFDSA